MDMTVKELIDAKIELEQRIANLVRRFEDRTGIWINEINKIGVKSFKEYPLIKEFRGWYTDEIRVIFDLGIKVDTTKD